MKNLLPLLKQNLFTIALVAAPLPFLFFVLHHFSAGENLHSLKQRLDTLEEKTIQFTKQKQKNEQHLAFLKKSQPQFLEKNLESLVFASLTSGENRLQFQEENARRSETLEEVDVKQKLPVSLNEEELKKVLSLIESIPIGSAIPAESAPQLLIKNFTLTKKMTEHEDELFEVSLELIKREPLRK